MLPIYEIRKTELTVKDNRYSLDFPEHMHKYIELVYVKEGGQNVTVLGREYAVRRGDALVIMPDVVHSYQDAEQGESRVLVLIASPKLFGELLPDLKNKIINEPLIKAGSIPQGMKTALEMISPNQEQSVQLAWACVVMTYTMSILKSKLSYNAPVEDISLKIIKYMEENFTENITRKSIARTFGVSECYVSKIFSQKLKTDMRNYLGLIRTEYAAKLIRATEKKFDVIAQLAGFGSFRSFNRTFKAVYGMTPGEYKKGISKIIRA